MRPAISIRIVDASIGIWQDEPRDPTFRTEVFAVLIRQMRERGWSVGQDPNIRKHHRCLNSAHRLAARGTMRASIEISGRVVNVEFWAVTWPLSNRNGRRYDFDKRDRMTYLDRLRLELEFKRITAWVETIAPVSVSRSAPPGLLPMERIERDYRESWHSDRELGRPVAKYASNWTSQDGHKIEHASVVWFADRCGRIMRGVAFYNINSMWWVVAGGELHNMGARELWCAPPVNVRAKRNERQRRKSLERELEACVRRMDFMRAAVLKRVLFPDQPVYLIWARDHCAYYRAQYSGYTTDTISAGRYSRAEAEREVRRVPHELEMVDLSGRHFTAAQLGQGA